MNNQPERQEHFKMMMTVNEISRFFHGELCKLCEENGVPVGYRSLLFHLARTNGCSQKELAQRAMLKPSTVSIALEKMERDGYVKREKNNNDARAVKVYLTEKGLNMDRKNKERVDLLEERFSAYVSKEEQQQVIQILQKAIRRYCADQGLPYPPSPPAFDKERDTEFLKEKV